MHFELSTKGSDEQGETEGIGKKRMVGRIPSGVGTGAGGRHAPALSCCSTPVSQGFCSSSFPLRKPLEDLVHRLSRKGLESFRLGVPPHAQS